MAFELRDSRYMFLYRVEHESTKAGPYARGYGTAAMRELACDLCRTHSANNSNFHPGMYDDLYDSRDGQEWKYKNDDKPFGGNLYCACDSIRSLKEWFDGFWDRLDRCGYVVKVYRVKREHYLHGNSYRQVFFEKQGREYKVLRMYEVIAGRWDKLNKWN